jgi:phage baseplate assembly protein gpV
MGQGLIEVLAGGLMGHNRGGFAIAPGIVSDNLDLSGEGRVKVRVPSMPGFEPWARVASVGAGGSRGFCWIPQVDDEVLLAFAQNDASTAYVLGGLWSTQDRPPLTDPLDFLSKRTIQTGLAGAPGHTVEFDDALQSITITTSTEQTITLDPDKIELSGAFGALTITLDSTSATITIEAASSLELIAPQISIEGESVEISGTEVTISSEGPCTVQGLPIQLN